MSVTVDDLIGGCKLLHLDAFTPADLFTDVAGTTGASNGSVIKCWKQRPGAILPGNFTGTTGFTYRSNYASSGYAGAEGNGSDSILSLLAAGMVPRSRFYFLIALTRPVSPTVQQSFISVGNNALHYVRLANVNATSLRIQSAGTDGGASTLLQTATINASSLRMVITGAVGANHNFIELLDGAAASTTGPHLSTSITDNVHLGGRYVGDTQIFSGAFHEVIIGDENCERGQIERAAKVLRAKWGVTDPSPLPTAASGGYSRRMTHGGSL